MSRDGRIRSEEVAVKFGRNLWRCRRRASLSQEELGARASLHRTEIGMLEQGTRLARVDTLMKLAGSLSVSPMELLEGIHWNPGDSSDGGFAVSDRTLPRRRGECS
ncbi:MAG TPA: helix-turn-helix transcriptional regulator [Solirubrobacterales bacterium]|nr:helix-turn-helix transcriptional regulator [Solirubrobacterales bacterium]